MLICSLVIVGSADAATEVVGDTLLLPSPTAPPVNFGQGIPVFQGAAGPSYVLRAAHSGTVVSWRFLSAGIAAGPHFVLRVLEPTGGNAMWKAVGTSAEAQVSTAAGVDAANGPFATNLAIKAGDAIAIEPTDGQYTPSHEGTIGVDGVRYFAGAVAEGMSAEVLSEENNGQTVPIQATVEYATEVSGPPAPPRPPSNVSPPSVTGAAGSTASPGQALQCSPGAWSESPTLSFDWYEQAAPGSRLTGTALLRSGPKLTVPSLRPGTLLFCQVTATASGKSTTTASGDLTIKAVKPALVPSSRAGRLGSKPLLVTHLAGGDLDRCSTGEWQNFPERFSYKWLLRRRPARGSAAKLAARVVSRSSVIKLRRAYAGSTILCTVTARNEAGTVTVSSEPVRLPKVSEAVGPAVSCGSHSTGPTYIGCKGTGISVIVPGQPAGKSVNPISSPTNPLLTPAHVPGVDDSARYLLECVPPPFNRKVALSYRWAVTTYFWVLGSFDTTESAVLRGHVIMLDKGSLISQEFGVGDEAHSQWVETTTDDSGQRVEKTRGGLLGEEVGVTCEATGTAGKTSDWGQSPPLYLGGTELRWGVDDGVIGFKAVEPAEEALGYREQ